MVEELVVQWKVHKVFWYIFLAFNLTIAAVLLKWYSFSCSHREGNQAVVSLIRTSLFGFFCLLLIVFIIFCLLLIFITRRPNQWFDRSSSNCATKQWKALQLSFFGVKVNQESESWLEILKWFLYCLKHFGFICIICSKRSLIFQF